MFIVFLAANHVLCNISENFLNFGINDRKGLKEYWLIGAGIVLDF